MKGKILNILLLITSFIGYLEWSGGNHLFLWQAEKDIIIKFFNSPSSVLHPFILIPFIGQLLLIFTLFQKKPTTIITYFGIVTLGILLLFMFIIGIISLNLKIISSCIPFLGLAIITIQYHRSLKLIIT